MNIRIGELLVREGRLTAEQIESALVAQQTFGGKLGTNLIELGLIGDVELASFLSKQLGIPAAAQEDFEDIPPSIIALIPKTIAEEHKVIPIRLDRKLTIAIGDAMDLATVDEIGFVAGKPVQTVIAPEIWIVAALERYYQIPRKIRYIKVEEDPLIESIASPPPAKILATTSKETGLSAQEYVERLLAAKTKEDVFSALCEFLSPWFSRSAVYVENREMIRGAFVRGFPVHLHEFARVTLPKEVENTIGKVISTQEVYVGTLPAAAGDGTLTSILRLPGGQRFEIYPVLFRGSPVAAVVGWSGQSGVSVDPMKEWIEIALRKAGLGLELGALRKLISDLT